MDTSSANCSTASRAAWIDPPQDPYFRRGKPASLARVQHSFKGCLATALHIASDGGDCFSVLDVRPPVILNVSAPDPASGGSAWAEVALTVVFEAPASLIDDLEGGQ